VDFEEVRSLSNTKWNIEVPEARTGISGGCLPKDVRFLAALKGPHPLVDGAIEADRAYRKGYGKLGKGNRA